ncbi:class I cytochrome c [Ramlibacter monticola]|uniref:Class I cytochrome c n=1 Tax=Ramlibacter monticola TaxID=1926872 RepID=A0A936Z1H1_9BURK|nr:c-type cytochrome [Ramlibacter monticola]MBL0393215.1 class I cytochrome c [Ramlibacter monticola]
MAAGLVLGGAGCAASAAAAADTEAAQALLRANNCTKCHSVAADKDGPSFRRTARGLAGRPNAEEALLKHLTSGEPATFPDGHEEPHKVVRTVPANDLAQVRNLVRWILEQK